MLIRTLTSFWFWFSITLLSIVVFLIILISQYGAINETTLTLIGSIIVGIGSFAGGLIKFVGDFKQKLLDTQNYVEKVMNGTIKETRERIDKANKDFIVRQLDYNNKASEFLIDSLLQTEKNILGEVRGLRDEMKDDIKQINDKVTKISTEMLKLQNTVQKLEECKNKKEFWAKELEKDWDGCKNRIKMIDNRELYSGALVLKDEFLDFVNEILSWELHCESESEKEIIINRIIEKFDAAINSSIRQIKNINSPEHVEAFINANKINEHSFKLKIEKSFKENLVNNVYKNVFNYSSQYLNEMLNTFVTTYLKTLQNK